ncbi:MULTISPECIES: DUF3784 domain-containing protein [Bacillaceae]|uniref:DUF3784 domain-containing protein n=1 Tax=Evansella alkalicola TaxID=745819 RepID=A0ABS6JY93_9BACI|nr:MULTISPECIES: DUF3784 domain-containing protein [Bacillaceae]MBU9723355.1 DUF3784 domain-containing protein [Bacillus alkalicola]
MIEVIVIVVFLSAALYLSTGKGSWLIAGFNMYPKEVKAKYNTVALCKFIGKVMFAITATIVIRMLADANGIEWLSAFGLVMFFVIIVFTLIYANTGKRFYKKQE